MQAYAPIDTTFLKATVDLRELVAKELGRPARFGPNDWTFLCPFHAERGPSFHVWPADYHCFGCQAHGDVFTWYKERNNIDFLDVYKMLGGNLPMSAPPPTNITTYKPPAHKEPPAPDWQQKATGIALDCAARLWEPEGSRALDWLRRRGLSDWVLKDYYIGYNPRTDTLHGLRVEEGITIPHFSADESTLYEVNVRRPVKEGEPNKYVCIAGSVRGFLYGQSTVLEKATVIITEGEFDMLLLWQVLHMWPGVGVCTLGAASNHSEANIRSSHVQRHLQDAHTLLIATDADTAGETAASNWMNVTKRARRLAPASGKDVTHFWQLAGGFPDGSETLRAWVGQHVEVL